MQQIKKVWRKLAPVLLIGLGITILTACRVGDPKPGQTIAQNYALDRVPGTSDVSYGPASHQKLDVYPVQGATATGIAIVYVHGGGWVAGEKANAKNSVVVQYLLDKGHMVFSIDYTLGDCVTSPFPSNLNDVKWAISWANLQSTKNTYGHNRVVVMGESAGAHLTSLATVSSHAKPPNMPSSRSVRPDAGIALGGPSNMVTFGAQGTTQDQMVQRGGLFFGLNLVSCFFGAQYTHPDQVPILVRIAATPDFFVDANDPPLYIASGTVDSLSLPPFNADLLEQKYTDLGQGKTLAAWNDRIEGGGHNTGHILNIAAIDLYLQYLVDEFFD